MSDLPTTAPVRHLTARNPEDLLALAPVLLGFWPDEDAVMLTFAAPRAFHARLSLPDRVTPDVLRGMEEAMLEPARRHGVGAVVFLIFGQDETVARAVCRALRRRALHSGIDVVACVWADGHAYRILGGLMPGTEEPVPYDISNHPFVVEAMVEGRLAYASRAEMVAALEADPGACRAVGEVIDRLQLDVAGPRGVAQTRRAVALVESTVRRHVGRDLPQRVADDPLGDAELARLVWSLRSIPARDAAWGLIDSRRAGDHRAFWARVLPRTPEPFVPAVADLLAFAAWQAGDGAQAWAAVDRAQRVCPGDSMAGLLADLLEGAVPPDAWSA